MKVLGVVLAVLGWILLMGGVQRVLTFAMTGKGFESTDEVGGFIGAAGVSLLMLVGGVALYRKTERASPQTAQQDSDDIVDIGDIETRE
jgi:hypothetical protein